MPQDKFFIAPYDRESGLNTSVKPWLIPDEAFSELNNAYVFRGRVRKRFGSRYFGVTQQESRFRVNLGNTDGSGNISTTTPGAGTPIVTPAIGQMFSIATQVFTVYQIGTPAAMLISGTATLATFNTTTGAVIINGAAITTALYYYPAIPVMGLLNYDTPALENEMIIGFDQKFAYKYDNGWERLNTENASGDSVWSGSDSKFFWGTTWIGTDASTSLFFVTNFNQSEPNFMRYFDGTTWFSFRPEISTTGPAYLNSALILLPFHDAMIALNTWEGTSSPGSNFRQRARYSAPGSPTASNQWVSDVGFLGGAIDASTTEGIVTAEFIKDRLIVFFERSTWEIVYTGNKINPFQWQQINTELGAESTFSIIPFDKVAIGVGNVGIHACNGANVERIDESIPQAVFQVHNPDAGITRVYGIRDYFVEMLYWTFPSITASTSFPYPNRVLVYNYQKDTWAFNDDSITAFGYFQEPTTNTTGDNTWASTTITWDDEIPWNSGAVQPLFRRVVAGNQEGFTFMVDADIPVNASVIQITNITSSGSFNGFTLNCINHNMRDGEYIYITGVIGTGNLDLLNNQIFQVTVPLSMSSPDPNNISIVYIQTTDTISGTYKGGGTYARVSNISIKTKEYNFYAKQARNFGVTRVDFMVDKTSVGAIQVDYYVATNYQSMVSDSTGTQTILGTNTLDTFAYPDIPFESTSTRIWHPVYFQGSGEVVQFQLSMTDAQITRVDNDGMGNITGPSFVDFQMHAMCIYATPTNYGFR